jgi:propionyl-CoA synthetase
MHMPKGTGATGLPVLTAGVTKLSEQVAAEVVQLVRDRIGAVASFKTALMVERLPKTRSAKILRQTMRKIVDGEDYKPRHQRRPCHPCRDHGGVKRAGFI